MANTYTQRTYTRSDQTEKLLKELEDHLSSKPADYNSQWLSQLDDTISQILNREKFSYDANTDPLYRQYRDNYVNHGRMAMMDTMGQAATLTGGYGNSFAQNAGQQAYQGYLQGMNDVMPQLYQLALETYDRQNQNLLNQYGILSDREALDYGRYQDGYGLWADQRDYLTGRYDAGQAMDYTQFRDMVGDDQWMAQFQEDIRRFDFENGLGAFAPIGGYGSSDGFGGFDGGKPDSSSDPKKKKKKGDETPQTVTYPNRIVVPNRNQPHRYTDESY